jgi:hypothetical protein
MFDDHRLIEDFLPIQAISTEASRFIPENGPDNKKQSLGRANAAKFIERLCKYPGNPAVVKEAQRHILQAHAERLTKETGKTVTVEEIEAGKAPRPKGLDMFAGGLCRSGSRQHHGHRRFSELRNTCLYLHYDGVRYCFKKDPNVTKWKRAEEAAAESCFRELYTAAWLPRV